VKRRAFYLFANFERVNQGGAPEYVSAHFGRNWQKIPIYTASIKNPGDVHDELYAVAASPRILTLYSRGRGIADFGLPKYNNWLTAKKLFLFPAAVAADAAGLTAVGAGEAAIHDPVGTAQTAAGLIRHH
jgi:hypothetical protein